jgi:NADH-quinone oxidoreductase subunit J
MVEVIFYSVASLLVVAALNVVFSRQPIQAVFSLIGCFFLSAIIWLIFTAEFLALALIFVYVGAVMTLFLFVVMMVHQDSIPKPFTLKQSLPYVFFLLGALGFMYGLSWFQGQSVSLTWETVQMPTLVGSKESNSLLLGRELYTHYFLSFQAAGLLLLVAIVAAVSLVFRGAVGVKTQLISEQIARRREDCVKLVKMDSTITKNEGEV